MRKRQSKLARIVGAIAAPVVIIAALAAFTLGLNNVSRGRAEEDMRQLEDVLHRAAVACYAADGVYPASLEQLVERCGVQIDESRYTVFYTLEGGNLMPDITVLERKS